MVFEVRSYILFLLIIISLLKNDYMHAIFYSNDIYNPKQKASKVFVIYHGSFSLTT